MLSICILTKNSQEEVSRLLPTLGFADQIVVVDDYSDDNTKSIALAHKCDVYTRHLNNDFSSQRNYALQKAKNEWVLFIDPDETISQSLSDEIKNVLRNPKHDGYFIQRKDVFMGKVLEHGETGRMFFVRLGRKKSGKWQRPVHEFWAIEDTGKLTEPIIHHAHQSIKNFIKKINYYTTIEANFRISTKKSTKISELFTFPIGKFIQNYWIKKGFLDGMQGFSMATMMSIHSYMVRAKQLSSQKRR